MASNKLKQSGGSFWKRYSLNLFLMILACNLFATAIVAWIRINWIGGEGLLAVIQVVLLWIASIISGVVVQKFMRENFSEVSFKAMLSSLLWNFWVHLVILFLAFYYTNGIYSSVIGWNFIPLIQGHYMMPTIFIIPPINVLLFFFTFLSLEKLYFVREKRLKALQKVKQVLSFFGVMTGLMWVTLVAVSAIAGAYIFGISNSSNSLGSPVVIFIYVALRLLLLFAGTLGVYRLVYKFRPDLLKLRYDFYVIATAVLLNFLLAVINNNYIVAAPFMESIFLIGYGGGKEILVLFIFGEISALILAVALSKGWYLKEKVKGALD